MKGFIGWDEESQSHATTFFGLARAQLKVRPAYMFRDEVKVLGEADEVVMQQCALAAFNIIRRAVAGVFLYLDAIFSDDRYECAFEIYDIQVWVDLGDFETSRFEERQAKVATWLLRLRKKYSLLSSLLRLAETWACFQLALQFAKALFLVGSEDDKSDITFNKECWRLGFHQCISANDVESERKRISFYNATTWSTCQDERTLGTIARAICHRQAKAC